MHIYRWDLDRTYLETEIDSVRGLVRAAMEEASAKRTVPGASALLRALQRHDAASRLVVISGSPLQMREVLAQKLALDGVRVDRLILKDNLGNLRRGRWRALRGQLGYKLPHLLRERAEASSDDTETLFGDDAEVDGLVYAVYAAAIAGEAGRDAVVEVLRAGEAYPDAIAEAMDALARIRASDAVEDIFIRLDRRVPLEAFELLGGRVTPVSSWFQAAVVLIGRGRLPADALPEVAEGSGLDARAAGSLVQDLVRRGVIDHDGARAAVSDPGAAHLLPAVEAALRFLGAPPPGRPRRATADFVGFLRAVR